MGFKINEVVPWGRNLEEYRLMFALSDADLEKKILGCADGPASFNAEMHQQDGQCISIDPIFQFSARQIRERVEQTAPVIAKQLEENSHDYVWSHYQTPQKLVAIRLMAMDLFLTDYEQGKTEGRYLAASLPELPFENGSFDLALCSHCLFSYSEQLDIAFHLRALQEMCRVTKEVRVFPLLEVNGKPSRHLDEVRAFFEQNHQISINIVDTSYEFQKGGNQMLLLQSELKISDSSPCD